MAARGFNSYLNFASPTGRPVLRRRFRRSTTQARAAISCASPTPTCRATPTPTNCSTPPTTAASAASKCRATSTTTASRSKPASAYRSSVSGARRRTARRPVRGDRQRRERRTRSPRTTTAAPGLDARLRFTAGSVGRLPHPGERAWRLDRLVRSHDRASVGRTPGDARGSGGAGQGRRRFSLRLAQVRRALAALALEHPAWIFRLQLRHFIERFRSSLESSTLVAARLSLSCASVFAPMMTLVTCFWCKSHESAICATETPRASPISFITSMMS